MSTSTSDAFSSDKDSEGSMSSSSSSITASSTASSVETGSELSSDQGKITESTGGLNELQYPAQTGCWPGFWDGRRSSFTTSYFLSTKTLLAWRVFAAVFCSVFLIIDIALRLQNGKLFIFLTVWSFCLLIAYFIASSALTAARLSWGESEMMRLDNRQPKWHERILWILWEVAAASSATVTLLFWALIFEGTVRESTVVVHGVNFLMAYLELWLGRTDFKLSHVVFFAGYGMFWVLWSAIYQWWWGRLIYVIIDWNHWLRSAGWCALGFFFGLLCYVGFFFSARLRDRKFGGARRAQVSNAGRHSVSMDERDSSISSG